MSTNIKKAGLTNCYSKSFNNYKNWLESAGIDYIVLEHEENNFNRIDECSILILTGGSDIHPHYSGLEFDRKQDYNKLRDEFEFKLFDTALEKQIPIIGICRGMQLINFRLNGTLVNDINEKFSISHDKIDNKDREHEIELITGTMIHNIIQKEKGTVNSSHHQCIDKTADELMISGYAHKVIPESLEWKDNTNKPLLIGVQWHPERMPDRSSPFTKNILNTIKSSF